MQLKTAVPIINSICHILHSFSLLLTNYESLEDFNQLFRLRGLNEVGMSFFE